MTDFTEFTERCINSSYLVGNSTLPRDEFRSSGEQEEDVNEDYSWGPLTAVLGSKNESKRGRLVSARRRKSSDGAALYNERLKTKWQGEEVPTEGRRRRWRT